MPFEKGHCANKEGRPKGAKGKKPEQFRELISAFLIANWEGMQKDFDEMEPKDRNRFRESLLKYQVPPAIQPERLTDEQMEQIIEYYENHKKES